MKKVLCVILTALMIFTIPLAVFASDMYLSLSKLTSTENEEAKFSNCAEEYVIASERMGICDFDDYTLPATRLEFCEMLYKMISIAPYSFNIEKTQDSFTDCNSHAVVYLKNIGVVYGTSENTFSPYDKIYCEEVAAIVYRLAKLLDLEGIHQNYKLYSYSYVDQDGISYWAVEAMLQLKATSLMDGVGNDVFAPKALFTREHAAMLIMELYTIILDNYNNISNKRTTKELRVQIQEEWLTDEIENAIKEKYNEAVLIETMSSDTYKEKTNLIIAAGEPCIIIGEYSEEFLEKLDTWGIECGEFVNGLSYIHSNIHSNIEIPYIVEIDVSEATVSDALQAFFENESISLTNEMDELAESYEYLTVMGTSKDLNMEIAKIAKGDYTKPNKISFLTIDDKTIHNIFSKNYPDIDISDSVYVKIKNRFNGSVIGNMINATYGSSIIASASILSNGKGYIMPNGFEDSTIVVLYYDGGYSSIVSFHQTGDGVIGANSLFVKNGENDIMEHINSILEVDFSQP